MGSFRTCLWLRILMIMILRRANCHYICDDCTCTSNIIDCSMKNISISSGNVVLPDYFRSLDLSCNYISELTSTTFSFVPPSLQRINVASNIIETVTKDTFSSFLNLTIINLSNNIIQVIEENAFHNHSTLIDLNLSFNRIDKLSEVTFFYLKNLQILDLSFNRLLTLDKYLFRNLNRMHTLDLSFMELETLHPELFDWNLTISTLLLSHNALTTVPTESLTPLKTLKGLFFSGNRIKIIHDGAFKGLRELEILVLEQCLYLTEIQNYAFRDLQNLESITLKYLPRIKSIGPKAFHTHYELLNETFAQLCPIHDFTFEFSTLTTMSEELLNWNELRYLSLKNNHWNCDCSLVWMKDSEVIMRLTGRYIYCSYPETNEGLMLKDLQYNDLTCMIFIKNTRQAVGAVIAIFIIGLVISLMTVAMLFYQRNGWLMNRPPRKNYDVLKTSTANLTIDEPRNDELDLSNIGVMNLGGPL